ncbi:hypothetical protein, partial [Burkholderia lata]|uniref:hypothetical protein n=1 Tax=Burkholderia lata (strain ATCC 17760 / DSM 23089 / LMG 22485 / NCIMB 9086 / R18194 / 383) TaxID=482957 RepID=UPI0020C5C5D1
PVDVTALILVDNEATALFAVLIPVDTDVDKEKICLPVTAAPDVAVTFASANPSNTSPPAPLDTVALTPFIVK